MEKKTNDKISEEAESEASGRKSVKREQEEQNERINYLLVIHPQ